MALQITITDAGRAEIINAQNTGTDPVVIAEIGLGTGQYVPAESQTALVAEFKRLTTFGGTVVADDTISIAIRDDSADVYEVSEFGLYTASGTLLAVYSVVGTPFFDKAAQSILLLAVDIKLTTLDAAALTFGDINFVNPPATETVMGVAELATAAEVQAGTDTERIVTPAGLSSRTATATRTGLVELATDAEGQTGTDTARAVTPAVMRADSATANTANRVVRRGASGEISVGAITADGNISGVNGTFTGPVSVQNLTYSGSLTGSTGVINIGSGQIYKTAGGSVGFGTESPTSRVTIGSGAFSAAASGTSGLYTAASGLLTILADGLDISTRGGSGRFTLDSAGNAGLGVTPSPVFIDVGPVFQNFRFTLQQIGGFDQTAFATNGYQSAAGVYRYIGTAAATRYRHVAGAHIFESAPSGTAGNPITFTQAMTLTQGGNLYLGVTGAIGGERFGIGSDTNRYIAFANAAGTGKGFFGSSIGGGQLLLGDVADDLVIRGSGGSASIKFGVGASEQVRITSSGYFKASNSGIYGNVAGVGDLKNGTQHVIQNSVSGDTTLVVATSSPDNASNVRSFLPSGSNGSHYVGAVNAATVFEVFANGSVEGQTEDLFNNTKRLASTAFVQRALGNYSNVMILTANTVLSAADAGKYIFINANGISVTLPNPATMPPGATITIVQSVTTSGAQIVAPAGVTMNGVMTGSTGSPIVMQQKAEYEIVGVTSTAYQVAMFGGTASLVANGYQFLPSGLIEQWGYYSGNLDDLTAVISLPIAYPTAIFAIQATAEAPQSGGSNFQTVAIQRVSNSQIRLNGQGSGGAATGYFWRTVGH